MLWYSLGICLKSEHSSRLKLGGGGGGGGGGGRIASSPTYSLEKCVYCINCTCYENFKLQLCKCAPFMLGTHVPSCSFKILARNVISGIVHLCEIILEISRNVNETTHDVTHETLVINIIDQYQFHWYCAQFSNEVLWLNIAVVLSTTLTGSR